jgi:hypothetical protein
MLTVTRFYSRADPDNQGGAGILRHELQRLDTGLLRRG